MRNIMHNLILKNKSHSWIDFQFMFFHWESGQTLFICYSLRLRDSLCKTCEHSFLIMSERKQGLEEGEKSPDIRQPSLAYTETIPIWQTRKERLLCLYLCFERLSPNISFAFKKEAKQDICNGLAQMNFFANPILDMYSYY